jgi:peptide-methionine (S)-S-oxide reductase
VVEVVSGYAGGHVPNPTYEEVCTGQTGHAEVIRVRYNPHEVSYQDLLDLFWRCHDPTTVDRQGDDVGHQYRSIILYHDEEQRRAAEASRAAAEASDHFQNPIVTEIVPLQEFYPAEDYHQDYFRKNPNAPYCVYVIAPKLKKLEPAENKHE